MSTTLTLPPQPSLHLTVPITHLDPNALAELKTQLHNLQTSITALQNAQSPLLRLPGELRNRILLYALREDLAECSERKRLRAACCVALSSCHRPSCPGVFVEPVLMQVCRQVRSEAQGLWYGLVAVWEEWVEIDGGSDGDSGGEHGKAKRKVWKQLNAEEVRTLCTARSKVGALTLVTQPSHGVMENTRLAVEASTSACPRRGMVRTGVPSVPQMKWWVW